MSKSKSSLTNKVILEKSKEISSNVTRRQICQIYSDHFLEGYEKQYNDLYWLIQGKVIRSINKHKMRCIKEGRKPPAWTANKCVITIVKPHRINTNRIPYQISIGEGVLDTVKEEFTKFTNSIGGLTEGEFTSLYGATQQLNEEITEADRAILDPFNKNKKASIVKFIATYIRIIALEAVRQGSLLIEALILPSIPTITGLIPALISGNLVKLAVLTASLVKTLVEFTVKFVKEIYRPNAPIPGLSLAYGLPNPFSLYATLINIAPGLVTSYIRSIRKNPPDPKKIKPKTLVMQIFAPDKYRDEISRQQAQKNSGSIGSSIRLHSDPFPGMAYHIVPHTGEKYKDHGHPGSRRRYIGIPLLNGECLLKRYKSRFRRMNRVIEVRLSIVKSDELSNDPIIKYQIATFTPTNLVNQMLKNTFHKPNHDHHLPKENGWGVEVRNGTYNWTMYLKVLAKKGVLKSKHHLTRLPKRKWNNNLDLMRRITKKTNMLVENPLVLTAYTLLSEK